MELGFIGCGNMAGAMIGGILRNHILPAKEIIASTLHQKSAEKVKESYGIQTTLDNRHVSRNSRILFLAVKPQYYEEVLLEIKDDISADTVIVSIAPGKSLKWLQQKLGRPMKIVRCMPNTPALVGEGITGVCSNEQTEPNELEQVCRILSGCGKTEVLSEQMVDASVAVSGSSPAYVFMFIEAMADAAVSEGMPRAQAYRFAAQAVLGSAKMVLETGEHPGVLKDMVCSPGGTTIEAVRVLEEKGLRSTVIEAMKACSLKAKKM